jgi:hypothetical protein
MTDALSTPMPQTLTLGQAAAIMQFKDVRILKKMLRRAGRAQCCQRSGDLLPWP